MSASELALVPGMGGTAPFWFAIVEDITEHRRVEESLRKSETRLQAFFENSPNLIFLKDREGRYLYVNKEFTRAFLITGEEIRGKSDEEIFSAEQAGAFRASDRRGIRAGVPMEFEEGALQEDGPHTSTVQRFPLFNAGSEIYAIGGIVTDIKRKRAEEELLTLKGELSAELMAMTCLHEFSTHLLAIREFKPLLEEVLDATIALQDADFGNIQVYNPETRALEIVVQRGFRQEFLEHSELCMTSGQLAGEQWRSASG